MIRRGPLITLASVVVLAGIFLWANTLVPKSGGTAEGTPSARLALASAPAKLPPERPLGETAT